jgi:S-(hydroxymethyl)glutathione dehydrogenase/alcohol dehydrogenase
MKTRAAILWEKGKELSVEEIDLDPPKTGEVLVRLQHSGICHSDEHLLTGDLDFPLPVIAGHEGAGIVEEVGPGVTTIKPGDHVILQFYPSCGRCPACVSGHQNLCDRGEHFVNGRQISDLTARHHRDGTDLGLMCMIGTFAEHTVVHEDSCIVVEGDVPSQFGCLLGCGVVTGWGSAVYAADVAPGDDVAVIGLGGVGSSAVQGARIAGARRIFGIDPVPFKREKAMELGATHVYSSLDEARGEIEQLTRGRWLNKAILTMGVGDGEMLGRAFELVGKLGRLVVTNMHPATDTHVRLNAFDLTMSQKQIVGTLYGSANPRVDVPRLIGLYRDGLLKLDEIVTRTYPLSQVNEAFDDLREGRNIRGVLSMD